MSAVEEKIIAQLPLELRMQQTIVALFSAEEGIRLCKSCFVWLTLGALNLLRSRYVFGSVPRWSFFLEFPTKATERN